MEPFSALLTLCAGNSPVSVNSPHKGQWRGALMLSLICFWINGWVNNREAGDLKRHRGHYDVIVMLLAFREGNPQRASNEVNISIAWRHHELWQFSRPFAYSTTVLAFTFITKSIPSNKFYEISIQSSNISTRFWSNICPQQKAICLHTRDARP